MARRDRDALEARMQELGIKGARVTPVMVDAEIVDVLYHQFPLTTVTVCCLTLANGFTVVGHSACADPANFRVELGQELAYSDAKDKIWQLLGFRLRDQIEAISTQLEDQMEKNELVAEGGEKDD